MSLSPRKRRNPPSVFIERNIPNLEILNEEALQIIERTPKRCSKKSASAFVENPAALERWRDAGADVSGERVRIPRGLARKLCETAPSKFTQIARNRDRDVEIGGNSLVLAPVYGPPFVRDSRAGGATPRWPISRRLVKLGYMSEWLHHSGGTVCEPTDVPVNKRHFDMLYAHMRFSDKPFMGSVTEPSRAADSVEMAKILFGEDVVDQNCVMTSLININSPLTFDSVMMGALEEYAARAGLRSSRPSSWAGDGAGLGGMGTLTQVLAEVLAGVAYSQLIRPGAPVIFGAFVTSIDMNSGAPTFGTPEAAQITYGAGQLARRLGLPYRSGGSFNGSKLPDAQAAYETANSLQNALLSGVNFMLHACGWLEGGLVSSPEKFVLDADQLGFLHKFAQGVAIDENAQAMDALREVGRAATSWAARTRRPITRTRSGAARCWTTARSRPGPRMAARAATSSPPTGSGSFWATIRHRCWIQPWTRRCATTWPGARPRCRTRSSRRR
jgi:trimethylamine--corrinoid protein Co-methyltransferase